MDTNITNIKTFIYQCELNTPGSKYAFYTVWLPRHMLGTNLSMCTDIIN